MPLRQKKLGFIACVLAIAFFFLLVLPPQPQGRAASIEDLQRQIQAQQKRLDELNKRAGQIQKSLKDREQKKDATLRELTRLEREIDVTEGRLNQAREQLNQAQALLEKTNQELARAEKDLARRTELLGRRLRAIYERGTVTYLDVLLASNDFADFVSRFENLQRIVAGDVSLFRRVMAQRDSVAQLKAQREAEQSRVATVVTQVSSTMAQLERNKLAKEKTKEQLFQEIESLSKAYDELDQQSRQITADLQRLQREYEKELGQTGAIVLSPPVNGRITSIFGPRFHPVLRRQRMHTGIDYGVPQGTPVKAAATGVVFLADWYGGYGKTVIIVHGKGISTLYAHMSAIKVTKGQRVEKGAVIGLAGSTGLSTGPHCHFEVRVNGEPRNPLDYLNKPI